MESKLNDNKEFHKVRLAGNIIMIDSESDKNDNMSFITDNDDNMFWE